MEPRPGCYCQNQASHLAATARTVGAARLYANQDGKASARAGMGRVLRPGGIIAVAVWDTLAATPGYAVVAEVLDELFGPEVAQSIQAPYALGETAKLRSLFAEAGLNDVTIETVTGTARFASIEAWMYTDIRRRPTSQL